MINKNKIWFILSLFIIALFSLQNVYGQTPTMQFTAAQGTVEYNESTDISWDATADYTSCSLKKAGVPWKTGLLGVNIETGSLTKNTIFKLECKRSQGSVVVTDTRTLTINVLPGVNIYVTVAGVKLGEDSSGSTHSLPPNTSYKINWTSSLLNTDSCTGDNFVTGGNRNNTGNGSSKTVNSPSAIHTLTCTGPGGSSVDTIIINQLSSDVPNPPLTLSCGLDVTLVMDNSGSIDTSEMNTMKSAMKGFVDALVSPEFNLSLVRFNRGAEIKSYFTFSTSTIKTRINQVTATPDTSILSSTNWQDGLLKSQATFSHLSSTIKPNLIIFASDGKPTVNNDDGGTGSVTDGKDLENAILVANAIKSDGTRIVAVGIGDDGPDFKSNLMTISGINESDPDYSKRDIIMVNDFGQVAGALNNVAGSLLPEICSGVETPVVISVTPGACNTGDHGKMFVRWNKIDGVDSYKVYRNNVLVGTAPQGAGPIIEHVDTGLVRPGQIYTYKVSAQYATIEGPKSDSMSATVPNCTPPPPQSFTAMCEGNSSQYPVSLPVGGGDVEYVISFPDPQNDGTAPYSYSWQGGSSYTLPYTESGDGPIVDVTDSSVPEKVTSVQCPNVTVAQNPTTTTVSDLKLVIGGAGANLTSLTNTLDINQRTQPGKSVRIKSGQKFKLQWHIDSDLLAQGYNEYLIQPSPGAPSIESTEVDSVITSEDNINTGSTKVGTYQYILTARSSQNSNMVKTSTAWLDIVSSNLQEI